MRKLLSLATVALATMTAFAAPAMAARPDASHGTAVEKVHVHVHSPVRVHRHAVVVRSPVKVHRH